VTDGAARGVTPRRSARRPTRDRPTGPRPALRRRQRAVSGAALGSERPRRPAGRAKCARDVGACCRRVVHRPADGPWRGHDLPQLPGHAAVHRVRRDTRRTATHPGDRHRPRSGDPACGLTCSGECPTTDRRSSHHPGVTDRSPSVVVRAHFTHIWGQLCGQLLPGRWMNGDGSVDNSWTVRGQLPGEPSCPPWHRPVHGPVPSSTHSTPRPATCPDDVHPHHPQALLLLLDVSLSEERRRTRRWMKRSGASGTPRPGPGPGMALVAPRLYGDRTSSARAQSRYADR
jgi:hypothetical protein